MANSCENNIQRDLVPKSQSVFPEHQYDTLNGVETGISIMGFRSGRYTPAEAKRNLNNRLILADKDIELSQNYRQNSADLLFTTHEKEKKNFSNSTEALRSRLQDIHRWARELENEIKSSIISTDQLIKRKAELEISLRTIDECLLITTDCINARERRFGEDLQQDEVEKELMAELDMENKFKGFAKEGIENLKKQINKNREAKANLEKAWSDKHEADQLDSEAAHLSIASGNTQYYPGEARAYPQAAQSTPTSWAQHAQDLILVSEEQRRASCFLSDLVEKLLISTEKTFIAQRNRVNTALMKRLSEYEFEKQQLVSKLQNVCKEISKLEGSIEELKQAKAEKEPYVKIVQTRLHLHNQRKNVENCRDPPQKLMLNELHDLQEMVDQLEHQIQSSIEKLKHLQDEQMVLERQLHMKNSSIQVDREHCLRHREHYPLSTRLRGH